MKEQTFTSPPAFSPMLAVLTAGCVAIALACLALSAWLRLQPSPVIDAPRREIIIETIRPATPPVFTGCPGLVLPFDATDSMVSSR